MALRYEELLDKLKKGRRKGNWRPLNRKEKALYRAAMAYTKPKKKRVMINGRVVETERVRNIVNRMVRQKLGEIVEKLMETRGMKILKRGFKKAFELLGKGRTIWKERNFLF